MSIDAKPLRHVTGFMCPPMNSTSLEGNKSSEHQAKSERCGAYIDLKMVRTGVVSHPAQWLPGGYAEIQDPPARYGVIDVDAPGELFGLDGLAALQ